MFTFAFLHFLQIRADPSLPCGCARYVLSRLVWQFSPEGEKVAIYKDDPAYC